MKTAEAAAWAACVYTCLLATQVSAQYGPPPTKNKKHRTTTTTTENPALTNEISGPFPVPDNNLPFPGPAESYPGPAAPPQQPTGTGSYAFSSASSSPGNNAVGGGSYWWSGPNSPFKPGAQPAGAPVGGGCGSPGGPGGCGQFPSSPSIPQPQPQPQPQPPSPPPPSPFPQGPSGGCGGPAGCTGLGTDPRPPPSEQAPKPVDIAQNPFLSSAILGKPIQGNPQGGYPAQPTPQYPGQPPVSGQQYPNQPQPTGSYPAQPQPQYPGQPKPQYPGQQPQPSGQFPNQQPQPTGQYPGQQPKPTGQYPGQQPQPSGQYPGQQPQPIGQYPGQQPQPTGQYPGQQPQPSGQYPSQQPQPTGQYPGQQPKPTGQFPGQPTGQYPGQQPQPTGQYPGQPQPTGQYPGQPQPTGQYPGQQPQPSGQYPGQPQPTGQYPNQPQPTGQYPGQQPQPTGQYPGQRPQPSGQYPGQPRPPSPYSGQPSTQGVPLRPQCAATDHACVPASMCAGGVITPNGLRQMKDPQIKECIPGLESCCRIPTTPGPGLATPAPGYRPTTQQPYTGPLNTTPYPGCPAALKCVAEIYCTAEGVMADTPVALTREQQENRVPLTDCQDLGSGLIGKCCRDPNYKDPWPAGMMMMKNPGDYDDGQYHGESSGPGGDFAPPFNSISPTPMSSPKDHGPKPSDRPGGYNKPFAPPFPGNSANSFPNTPERQQPPPPPPNQPNPFEPKPTAPSGKPTIPDQPNQPIPSDQNQPGLPAPAGSYQPNQPSGTPYQPGQPSSYQPGQPSPYQPGQPSSSTPSYQPSQPSQPGQPSPYQPGQPSPPTPSFQPPQPSQPGETPYQPGPSQPVQPPPSSPAQPSTEPDQLPDTYQPGQPVPPGPQNNYGLPTHPGQNNPAEPDSAESGPAPGTSCGVRRPGPEGEVAGFAEFPWQALVVAAGNRTLLCGAAIIADNAVVTAAHCVNQLRSQDLLVKAGEWKLLGQNPKQPQVRPVGAISRHPNYDSGSLAKDLAILVVSQPFTLDTHVDKICVPPQLGAEYFQRPGQKCVVTGWGKQALQGPVQNSDLHKVDINVVPSGQCEAQLKSSHLGKYFKLNEGFSCVLPSNPTDICKVDFGSGIACDRGDGFYELAGVNSWDLACQTKQPLPTVIATSDADWINAVLAAPLPQLQQEEEDYIAGLLKGENVDGIDVDDKPGFSQGYGK